MAALQRAVLVLTDIGHGPAVPPVLLRRRPVDMVLRFSRDVRPYLVVRLLCEDAVMLSVTMTAPSVVSIWASDMSHRHQVRFWGS